MWKVQKLVRGSFIFALFIAISGTVHAAEKEAEGLSCQTLVWIDAVFAETRSISHPNERPALFQLYSGVDLKGVQAEVASELSDRQTKAIIDFLIAGRPGARRGFADLRSARKWAGSAMRDLKCDRGAAPLQEPGTGITVPKVKTAAKVFQDVSEATGISARALQVSAQTIGGFLTIGLLVLGTIVAIKRLKRKHRYLCDIPVEIEFAQGGMSARLVNISTSGCKLSSDGEPNIRSQATLRAPGMEVQGKVVWSTISAFALHFDVALNDRAIQDLLSRTNQGGGVAGWLRKPFGATP